MQNAEKSLTPARTPALSAQELPACSGSENGTVLMTAIPSGELLQMLVPSRITGAELQQLVRAALAERACTGHCFLLEAMGVARRFPRNGETLTEAGLHGSVMLQVRAGLVGGIGGGLRKLADRKQGSDAGRQSNAGSSVAHSPSPRSSEQKSLSVLLPSAAKGMAPLNAVPKRLSADAEEEEMVRDVFNEIDSDHDGIISLEELQASVNRYTNQGRPLQLAMASALRQLIQHHASTPTVIGLDTFREAVKDLPRVRAERVLFAKTLGLHELLAGQLPKGTFFDGLDGLKRLGEQEVAVFAREAASLLTAEMETLIFEGVRRLQGDPVDFVNALEQNSKFSMEPGAIKGSFAKLADFYDGPEKIIGTPNPKAEEGIQREHCERKNADTELTTQNYKLTTSPKKEYYFVVDPARYRPEEYPHTPKERDQWSSAGKAVWRGKHGRDIIELRRFTQHDTAKRAGLKDAEVISLRLYTGPMYIWYNAVLRGFPEDLCESLSGNRYETTIFCIISGIVKLSKLTEVPEDRRLYRGLGGILLPDSFWIKTEGFRGGVERGLMSATMDRHVAMQYSGSDKERGTVLEIAVGRIDIGADLCWVSQYPGEREVLFPPLSCLEVMGEPRVEDGVIVIPLRVNMCLKGLTLEQLVQRRKELHMAMVANLKEELSFQAPAVLSRSEALVTSATAVLKSVEQQFRTLENKYMDTAAHAFNDDLLYKTLTTEAIEGKSLAIKKVEIYADQLNKGAGVDILEAILERPLQDFSSRAVVLELETGMCDFPWSDVVDQKAIVNFGRWRPEGTAPDKLNFAVEELFKNPNFRTGTMLVVRRVEEDDDEGQGGEEAEEEAEQDGQGEEKEDDESQGEELESEGKEKESEGSEVEALQKEEEGKADEEEERELAKKEHNEHFVEVMLSLTLSEGLATEEINWQENSAVKESPALVALLIQKCVKTKRLDLR